MFQPWLYLLQLYCQTQINWMRCAGSISSANGARWMKNVTVWSAARLLVAGKSQLAGGTRGNGSLRISCPTERCNSIPMDWVLPTDEILARVEMMAAEECKTAARTPASHGNGGAERS